MKSQLSDIITLTLNRTAGRFRLMVGDQVFDQTTCEFLLTFAFMQGKNMEEYLMNPASEYDSVRVPLSGCGSNITLELSDFIRLRALYSQKMFDLKLEDMLIRQGVVL